MKITTPRNPVKITAQVRDKIRKLTAYGLTAQVVAERLGIHERSVRRALRGESAYTEL